MLTPNQNTYKKVRLLRIMFWIAVSVSVYAKWTENLFLDHLSVPFLTFLLIY